MAIVLLLMSVIVILVLLVRQNYLNKELAQVSKSLSDYKDENNRMISEITKTRMVVVGLEDQLKSLRSSLSKAEVQAEMHLEELNELKLEAEKLSASSVSKALEVPAVPEVPEVPVEESKVVKVIVATPPKTETPNSKPKKTNRRRK